MNFIKENYKSMLTMALMIVLAFTLGGCRTVKKEWLEENYTATDKLSQMMAEVTTQNDKRFQEISETFKSRLEEISNMKSETTRENESTNTTVSGSITAEDGVEKSATIGDTKITSKGANITFETNSSKSISKEFLESFQQISKELQAERQYREDLQREMNTTKLELYNLQRDFESYKESQSKNVKQSGASFGVWLWLLIIAVVILLLWRLKVFRGFTI